MIATYCIRTDRLRLYDIHDELSAGMKQKLVAIGFSPLSTSANIYMAIWWTPERHDYLIELCGDVEVETICYVERKEVSSKSKFNVVEHLKSKLTQYKSLYVQTQKDLIYWKSCDFSKIKRCVIFCDECSTNSIHHRLKPYMREFTAGNDAMEELRAFQIEKYTKLLLHRKRWITHVESRIRYFVVQ